MLTRFDHIIKNALIDLSASYTPDWSVFQELLRIEESFAGTDASGEFDDQEWGDALHDLQYTGSAPDWTVFEAKMDSVEDNPDAEFDRTIREGLQRIPDAVPVAAGSWMNFTDRIDELNAEMDGEFDQSIADALDSLPEATWQERHWQMLSTRLDRLNDRPRILMMKVIEAAAVILLLVQLSNLYSGFQQNKNRQQPITENLTDVPDFKVPSEFGDKDRSATSPRTYDTNKQTPHTSAQSRSDASDFADRSQADRHLGQTVDDPALSGDWLDGQTDRNQDTDLSFAHTRQNALPALIPEESPAISYDYVMELKKRFHFLNNADAVEREIAPSLNNDPQLITYQYRTGRSRDRSPQLGIRDISLLFNSSMDSVLSSIPSLQVIRPKIYSSIEAGFMVDATDVEIKNYTSITGSYIESTLNPGAYFRYKIQYQDIFGSLGADYVEMKYPGSLYDNQLTMVSLPVELGYNFVNLSAFRMYVSGGVAGRFVPTAEYSPETYNQESTYGTRSSASVNGLLHNGPFEINSYLSGRLSMGLDININKKTSVSLRYSRDLWLKGVGIGYNWDTFQSNHLAIGASFHL